MIHSSGKYAVVGIMLDFYYVILNKTMEYESYSVWYYTKMYIIRFNVSFYKITLYIVLKNTYYFDIWQVLQRRYSSFKHVLKFTSNYR